MDPDAPLGSVGNNAVERGRAVIELDLRQTGNTLARALAFFVQDMMRAPRFSAGAARQ